MSSNSQDDAQSKTQSKIQGQAQIGKEGGVSDRPSLPFEPKSRKADSKADSKIKSQPVRKAAQSASKPPVSKSKGTPDSGIPQVVSRRMARRMAFFCGVPTALGMLTFVVSYWVVSHDLLKLPTYAVLLVSLGWFGLGVLGLTYGVLSASWEEEAEGSRFGIAEFKTNLGRTTEAWKENAEKAKTARAAQSKDNKKS
jgi:hypothetical protein